MTLYVCVCYEAIEQCTRFCFVKQASDADMSSCANGQVLQIVSADVAHCAPSLTASPTPRGRRVSRGCSRRRGR